MQPAVLVYSLVRSQLKVEKMLLLACPVCPHVRTRKTLNGFSQNLIFGSSTKICPHIAVLVEIGQK
jgi:hypothetical protein